MRDFASSPIHSDLSPATVAQIGALLPSSMSNLDLLQLTVFILARYGVETKGDLVEWLLTGAKVLTEGSLGSSGAPTEDEAISQSVNNAIEVLPDNLGEADLGFVVSSIMAAFDIGADDGEYRGFLAKVAAIYPGYVQLLHENEDDRVIAQVIADINEGGDAA